MSYRFTDSLRGVSNAVTTTINLRPRARRRGSNQISENPIRHLTTNLTMSYIVIDFIGWASLSLSNSRHESM